MPELLHCSDFAPYLHTVFKLETEPPLDLELAEVTDRSNPQVEGFSLIFLGPVTPWFPQGIYTLGYAETEKVTLFLVPLGPRDGHMAYEAVFARLIPRGGSGA
jgi:hypothetical protein